MKRDVDKYFEENKPYAGLGRTSLLGGATYVAARAINIIVQVASTILLARLLSPYDFGLVAMVLALVGFAPMLIDLGTSDASIQKTSITQVEVSTLFWLNIAIGGVLAVLLAAGSGLIAAIFGEPALTGIALVSSFAFITAALSTQHTALMRRAMQFRHLAIIDIASNVISSTITIIMAFTGWGYWALVAKPIMMTGFSSQKNDMVVYMLNVHQDKTLGEWFKQAWAKTDKRLSLEVGGGGCCVRFKKLDDLALDVIGESIRRTPAKAYIGSYTRMLADIECLQMEAEGSNLPQQGIDKCLRQPLALVGD